MKFGARSVAVCFRCSARVGQSKEGFRVFLGARIAAFYY